MTYTPKTWTSLYPTQPEPTPYHPAYTATPGPRRLEGEHHRAGICGGNADLCGQCHEWELAWHLEVARKIGATTPLLLGEGSEHYWQRVGGRYLDTYIEARRVAFCVALTNVLKVAL